MVGAGTALFVAGTCYCPGQRIDALWFLVDGVAQPVNAHSMPRLDFFRALHPGINPYESPDSDGYLSGFWGLARITEGAGPIRVGLRAELDGGPTAEAELARVARAGLPVASADVPEAEITICMATYNPPSDLLRRQLDSIRAQTHTDWLCLISDDCSSPERFEALTEAVANDPRFMVSRAPRRLGFYNNFERVLALVPRAARFVAVADQDDYWHPDKLATLRARLGDAQLAYSDARIVARDGQVISNTYWSRRANNHSDLLSLLVANAVTGAASLLRRELLDYALPFPPAQFAHFHDHWIGLTALALGDIGFEDRPLYDYVQHAGASLGHAAANQMAPLRERFARQRDPHERVRMWRLHYFGDACRLLQVAAILEMRCGTRMTPAKRRALRRFMAADEGSARSLMTLAARGGTELLGIGRRETLGAEWMLLHAFLWRRLLPLTVRERPQRRLRLDAVPPPSLAQSPTRSRLGPASSAVAEKIAPLALAVSDRAPRRVNLLIPTIDLEHFFGGYIAKFNLARRLAELGLRVRIVTVDPVPPLPSGWRQTLEGYAGLANTFDRVEVVSGRGTGQLEVSAGDGFIATTWWTAHIAAGAVQELGGSRFAYLIQEYEPFTFPMGTHAALASQSYEFEHYALFSSELLRDYFRRRGLGVYATGPTEGDEASDSFENAITVVRPPGVDELRARASRRLLFYARPEPHAARNMFELGVLALSHAALQGVFGRGWELRGIGAAQSGGRIELGGGAALELTPRAGQGTYGELLREHDVGLALMYTPHPSLVPIEMAGAGLVTVTNSFENKTAAAMAAISDNLVTVAPTVHGIADGLLAACSAVADLERRVRGSDVRWSRNWDQSFPDELMARVAAAVGQPLAERVRP